MKILATTLRIARGYLLLSFLLLTISTSRAQVITTLLSEDFSSAVDGGFPPNNWSTDGNGNFHGSVNGDGGVNGSAMFDMYNACDYSFSDHLYSPQLDASAFNGAGGTVTFDFDYWMEQNGNDFFNGGNHLVVYVDDGQGNRLQLDELWSNQNFTFDNSSDFNNDYFDPLTDPSLWGHRHYTIPSAYCTSTMSVLFLGEAVNTCQGGNFGVDNVALVGTELQNITYVPTGLLFGLVAVGTASKPQCVTVTNPSNSDVAISSILIQGSNPEDFQLSGEIPETIPANGSINICVDFLPQTSGFLTADLLISNGSGNHPSIDVLLTGTGAVPVIEIDPIGSNNTSTTMFKKTVTKMGSFLEQCLLVKNTGQVNLIIDPATYLSGAFPGEYTISHLPPHQVFPGMSDTICVRSVPTIEGKHGASLFILSNASNGTQQVDLFATGILPKIIVSPAAIAFDSVGIGDTVCKSMTITNPGSDTLIVGSNFLSSTDGDFHYSGLSRETAIIPPGTSATVSVCFSPIQRGSRLANLLIETNIPKTFEENRRDTGTINVTITGTGVPFGKLSFSIGGSSALDSVLVDTQICQSGVIRNSGDADITITNATIGGNQASEFRLSGITIPMKIPAQSAIPVTICATPAASGLRLATLTLSGTASGKNINGSLPLEVFGEVACASPNPAALFASVKVVKNNFDTESVVITNCGDVPGVYTGAVSGDGYSILSPAGGVTAPVAPRASVTFQIVFNPSSTGVKNGNLLVHSPSIANLTIPLSGEGACAIPTAQTFNIPQTGVGNTNTFDITITNTGNFGWTPGTGVITPADVFSVISITPATIPPGGSADVKVQFAPKATGLVTAQLTFPNAGPCEETTVKVDLSGTGVVSDVKQISADGMWLEQNYPNPFTSYTTFSYSLPTESAIRISVSDMTGKVIKELVSGRVSAGEHTLSFNASTLASSTYVYTLECGPIKLSRNFVLSK